MLSIKIEEYDVDSIMGYLGIIVKKYIEKNCNLNNAIILMPSIVYKIINKECNHKLLSNVADLYGWMKIIEDKYLDDMIVIIDKENVLLSIIY